jgi:hypothetical protein
MFSLQFEDIIFYRVDLLVVIAEVVVGFFLLVDDAIVGEEVDPVTLSITMLLALEN